MSKWHGTTGPEPGLRSERCRVCGLPPSGIAVLALPHRSPARALNIRTVTVEWPRMSQGRTTGYALAPVSTSEKTVYLPSVPASDDLTQRDLAKFPYLNRTGWSSSQPHHPLGRWACD